MKKEEIVKKGQGFILYGSSTVGELLKVLRSFSDRHDRSPESI